MLAAAGTAKQGVELYAENAEFLAEEVKLHHELLSTSGSIKPPRPGWLF